MFVPKENEYVQPNRFAKNFNLFVYLQMRIPDFGFHRKGMKGPHYLMRFEPN